jgi:hypothetical protein
MPELLEVEKIASIVTAAKNDVAAGRIVAEGSKHFLYLMIGPLLAVADIYNTKQRLAKRWGAMSAQVSSKHAWAIHTSR